MKIFEVFSKKKKLSFVAMSRLIEENARVTLDGVVNVLTEMNSQFDLNDAKLNILSINYELCRYELYKSNDKIDVNDIMEDLYTKIYYDLNIKSDEHYEKIIDEVINKSKEIFNVNKLMAPAETFSYRLLLEQLEIKENNVSKQLIQDLIFYAKNWVNNAVAINKTYSIDTSEDNSVNQKIDFKF